jgi:micrococcal nuclease
MYQYKCNILEVIDGDTVKVDIDAGFNIWIKSLSIRLIGIDTPESRTSNEVEKLFGNVSKYAVQALLPVGSTQIVQTTIDDKYGRLLGDFLIEGKSLCDLLIAEGYAVPYNGQNKSSIARLHLANRKRLVKEGKVQLPSTAQVV